MKTPKNKTLLHDLLRGALIGLFAGILVCIFTHRLYACTYEEALNADYMGYNPVDVARILQEDITQPSNLSDTQKEAILLYPMSEYCQIFDDASQGVKYEVLTAISALETGYFTSDVVQAYNNVGGMIEGEGYMSFPDIAEGIKAYARLLTEDYLNSDGRYYEGTTIVDVGEHYNPSVEWVSRYVKIRLDMERRASNAPKEKETKKYRREPEGVRGEGKRTAEPARNWRVWADITGIRLNGSCGIIKAGYCFCAGAPRFLII